MACVQFEIEVRSRDCLTIKEVCDVFQPNDDLVLCFWEVVNLQFSAEVLDLRSDASQVEFISLA